MRYGLHYDDDADEDGLSLQKAHTIYILFLVADLRRYIERKAYDPNEPRDDHGRWTAGGGSGAVSGTQVADNSNIGPLSTDDMGAASAIWRNVPPMRMAPVIVRIAQAGMITPRDQILCALLNKIAARKK